MNIKNLRIGDSIQYQLPLFDPQEGKITKIYTDSVVVNNTIHVSEKYIIKKVNKDKISINDLKIGDRVKYKDKIAYCGTTTVKEIEVEGNILEIHDKFYQISDDDNRFDGKQLSVKKENIISKLEHIILEPQYKEIPIEKEENPYYTSIVRTVSYPYSTPVTSYYCPKCDKKLWGTCGMPIKEYTQEPCEECKNKEKPTPKSFKFDFFPTQWSANREFNDYVYTMDGFCNNNDGKICNLIWKGLLSPDWIKVGKTYTIEIKEKE